MSHLIQKPNAMPTLPSEQGCPIRWSTQGSKVVLEVWVQGNRLGFELDPADAIDICNNGIHEAIEVREQTLEFAEKA